METTPTAGTAEKSPAVSPAKAHKHNEYVELAVANIISKAGENVRTGELPDIDALANSIKAEGVLEPIIVTQARDTAGTLIPGKYSVVAGHRRLTAVRLLEMPTIPAVVIDADTDRKLKVALIENIQRVDMNPVDKARGLSKLIESTGLDQKEAAQALGVAPGFVSQYLAILGLPKSALTALSDGDITFTQARSLCRLLPNTKAIDDLVFEASSMTVAQLDSKVSFILSKNAPAPEEGSDEAEGEEAPKKKAKKAAAKPAQSETAIKYYEDAEFKPLKKEDLRHKMMEIKAKELKAESEEKKNEFRLILKGLTMAADLRLK